MDAFSGGAGEAQQALGAETCRFGVAPYGMARRIAFALETLAGVEPEFVLAMEGGAAADIFEDCGHACIIINQKIAGRRAHEHLGAGATGKALELAQQMGIVAGAAHIEGEIAEHAVGGAGHLVGQGFGRSRQRLGVGHLEYAGHATHDGGAATGFEVFLVFGTGLAEMHLAVDDTGENVEASAIEGFGGAAFGETANSGNAAIGYGNVADADAVVVHDGGAFEDQVHGPILILRCSPQASLEGSAISQTLRGPASPGTSA